MTDQKFALTDELLGAYVDGELDRAAAGRVEQALATDLVARKRLDAIRHVSMLVRAATRAEDPSAAPNGARAHVLKGAARGSDAMPARGGRTGWSGLFEGWRAAAAFACAGAGAVLIGLQLFGGLQPAEISWAERALIFQEHYLSALNAGRTFPLDAPAGSPREVGAVLASALGGTPAVPDLSAQGYRPRGARLIITPVGAVTHIFYEASGKPLLGLTLGPAEALAKGSAAQYERGNLRLVDWSNGQQWFGLTGSQSAEELHTLADSVMPQLNAAVVWH